MHQLLHSKEKSDEGWWGAYCSQEAYETLFFVYRGWWITHSTLISKYHLFKEHHYIIFLFFQRNTINTKIITEEHHHPPTHPGGQASGWWKYLNTKLQASLNITSSLASSSSSSTSSSSSSYCCVKKTSWTMPSSQTDDSLVNSSLTPTVYNNYTNKYSNHKYTKTKINSVRKRIQRILTINNRSEYRHNQRSKTLFIQ